MTTLSAQQISYGFRNHPILAEVSLDLQPGCLLGLLGINGSGKSTLLNCLDDVLAPQAGDVLFDQEPISCMSPNERAQAITYVTQHSHANRTTVYETLLLGRKPYMKGAPTEADHQVVEQVITAFHLEELAPRYINELSGGEYQKMIIARAFVQDTPVMLLDEPTNNLDLANQLIVLDAVRRAVDERQVAGAIVLHDINLALWYCDEIAFLQDGKLVARVATPDVSAEMISQVFGVQAEIIAHKGRRVVIVSPAKETPKETTYSTSLAVESPSETGTQLEAGSSMSGTPFGDVAAYFDKLAEEWQHTCKLPHDTRRRLDQLLPDLEDKRILDVACGTGVMVPYYLKRNAAHVTAIDISENMAAIAKETFAGEERVQVLCGDVLTAPLDPVDIVIIYNAYPHFLDKEALVARVNALLAPGGVCLIAHSMGRGALNGHHGAHAAGVSVPLNPAVQEMQPWLEYFEVTALADEENFFAIRLEKPRSTH